jgi:hypothetical protein
VVVGVVVEVDQLCGRVVVVGVVVEVDQLCGRVVVVGVVVVVELGRVVVTKQAVTNVPSKHVDPAGHAHVPA